jgi:hypothetical protein
MHDRCPTCGKPTGYLLETNPDAPGVIENLRGEAGEARRVLVMIAVCLIVVLAITATRAVLMQ